MTEVDRRDPFSNPDISLILDVLSGDADREQLLEVRRRLDDDPAFRELAVPFVYAAMIPKLLQRRELSRERYEQFRDDFARRVGITLEQPRRGWRRFVRPTYIAVLLGIIALIVALWTAL